MTLKLPYQFGKYLLLDLIARGGMAEVYRAKAKGEVGVERLYAIKRILPELAENREFIDSLINEAKITVTLSHSNIAQVYDLGKADDTYYIAMEYVHGLDLHSLVDKLHKKHQRLALQHSLFIAMGMLAGLDVAHRKRDDMGRPLGIVHRDISPHNVIISYAGEVKIIDFGIARAANKLGHTRQGVIKGKLLYMAPEQARAAKIDHRADLFAVAMTLYWMLTGVLPFDAQNQYEIYQKVVDCRIPNPSKFNPNIPPKLLEILHKALQSEPGFRYQDAYEFRDALEKVLLDITPNYGQKTLRGFIENAFGTVSLPTGSMSRPPRDIAQPQTGRSRPSWAKGLTSIAGEQPGTPKAVIEDFEEKPTLFQIDSPDSTSMKRARARKRKERLLRPTVGAAQPVQRRRVAKPQPESKFNQIFLYWGLPLIMGLLGATLLALILHIALLV